MSMDVPPRMGRIRSALTAFAFAASALALVMTYVLCALVLSAYPQGLADAVGVHVPAFSVSAYQVALNSAWCAFGTLAATVALAFLAWRQVIEVEQRRFWLVLLAVFNYHVALVVAGTVVLGIFVLPKLANMA